MDIFDWNEFLWRIVKARLYEPGSRLYLAFDDSLLEDELGALGRPNGEHSATEALNNVIQQHRDMLPSGIVGLSEAPNGRCRRHNWQWVFRQNDNGVSLALVFAVQQVLAAEQMRGVSFYAAYWGMLGLTADEVRVNPFGDGGKISFEKLWSRLKLELRTNLHVKDAEITFCLGRGSNKYRNLPISQSLLSKNDLNLASSNIRRSRHMTDAALYAALRKAHLSKSGRRKVYIAALRDQLVKQFRDYTKKNSDVAQKEKREPKKRTSNEENITRLLVYEEVEFFGDPIFHCVSQDGNDQIAEILEAFFSNNRCLLFTEQLTGIHASSSQILRQQEGQLLILTETQEVPILMQHHFENDENLQFDEYFSEVTTSLPGKFALLQCLSIPSFLVGIDFSKPDLGYAAGFSAKIEKFELHGGLCVNRGSRSYILGAGPNSISISRKEIDRSLTCELDMEEMQLQTAFEHLSSVSVPCRFQLRLCGVEIYIDMVGPCDVEVEPAYARTDRCVLPISLLHSSPKYYFKEVQRLLSPEEAALDAWPSRRKKRLARLAAETYGTDVRWIKVDESTANKCVALLMYFDLPSTSKVLMANKVARTKTAPWALYAEVKQPSRSDREAGSLNGITESVT